MPPAEVAIETRKVKEELRRFASNLIKFHIQLRYLIVQRLYFKLSRPNLEQLIHSTSLYQHR